jgi:hypothetical protein
VVALVGEHGCSVHGGEVPAHRLQGCHVRVAAQSLHEGLVAHAEPKDEAVVIGRSASWRRWPKSRRRDPRYW